MFNKFTASSRQVLITALQHARHDAAPEIGTDHLLRGLLEDPEVVELVGLDEVGTQHLADRIERSRRSAGLSPADSEALAAVGIDLDVVVERIEAELGTYALRSGGRQGHRLRTALSVDSRAALAAAGRHASMRSDRALRPAHVLLGVLTRRDVVADLLGEAGVTVATVLSALESGQRRVG